MVEHCKMMKHQEDMEASTIQGDLKNSPFHKILLLSLETTQTPPHSQAMLSVATA
jgi:hypothetical protein